MVKKLNTLCVLITIICLNLFLFGCSHIPLTTINCVGGVKFLNYGLEGVTIKTNTKEYAVSNDAGFFEFKTKNTDYFIFANIAFFIEEFSDFF